MPFASSKFSAVMAAASPGRQPTAYRTSSTIRKAGVAYTAAHNSAHKYKLVPARKASPETLKDNPSQPLRDFDHATRGTQKPTSPVTVPHWRA
jgi:hypothetical protein